MATNLYEYYKEQGKNLPSVKERQTVAQEAGISGYKGTAEQNTKLLSYLKTKPLENPTPVSDVKPETNYNLPEPEAPVVQDSYLKSLSYNLENTKKAIMEHYQSQREEIASQKEAEQKRQDETLEKLDPTKRATYQQEQANLKNQLRTAETASRNIGIDMEKRRRMTSEMEGLLNRSNAILNREAGLPVGQRVISARNTNALNDIVARAGVLEAVFSAIDGNISQSYTAINQAQEAVAQQWRDTQNYYGTILELSNQNLLKLDKEEKEIAEREMSMAEADYTRSLETSEYIKSLMIDPESAQFIADAGVKLNDSIEVINDKMAKQARIKEVNDVKNEMIADGYEYVPFPTYTADLIPVVVGGQTLYFKDKGGAGGGTVSTYKLTPTQRTKLLGAGLTLNEIDELHNSIQQYGIESVVNAITDETQRQVIADIYGYTPTEERVMATKEENESYIRENLTTGELKDLADWLGVSKWWRRKTKDINEFFEVADEEQLNQIRIALEEGYTVGEIISFLNEI